MICKCLTLSITYAATIGGLITITGTSTNLIFAEQFNTYVNVHAPKKHVSKSGVSISVAVFGSMLAEAAVHPRPDWFTLTASGAARSEITIISLGTTPRADFLQLLR